MRILLVGAGGVGTAIARIAARRPFAELVIADYDLARAQRAAAARDSYQAVQLDARDEQATAELLTQRGQVAVIASPDEAGPEHGEVPAELLDESPCHPLLPPFGNGVAIAGVDVGTLWSGASSSRIRRVEL